VYAGINNLGNQDPPRTPGANGSGNNVLFDPVGRTYKMGFRMQY
jgi:iron complex outermembrane receptor protein